MKKPFLCGHCKKTFTTERGVEDHAANVHKRAVVIFKAYKTIEAVDSEPSIADRMIEAQLQEAMGEHVDDDWLLDAT